MAKTSRSQRREQAQAAAAGATWREKIATLRYVPPLIKLIWQTHRGYTLSMMILRLVRSLVPIATLWAGKLIVDAVVGLRENGGDMRILWERVALEIGIVLAGQILSRASAMVESLLGDLFANHTSIRLMEHAATLDLYHFEDPDFYDRLERARQQTTSRIRLLTQLFTMGQSLVTLITLGAALLAHSPWLLLLLVVSVIPSFLGETHFASLEYSLLFRWTPQRRQLDYIRYLGASDETAKEVQMFGLAPWLVRRYRTLAEQARQRFEALGISNAFSRQADGATGLPNEGPFDRIVAWVAFPDMPRFLLDQLSSGGVVIAAIGAEESEQVMTKLTKVGSRFEREDIGIVRFQPVLPGLAAVL